MVDALHAITTTIQADQASPASDYGSPGLADRIEALGFERYPLAGLLRAAYAMFTQDSDRAGRYIEEARASQDEWLVAATWMMTGALADNNGDMDTLRSASARALERFRAIGERWGLSSALRMAAGIRVLDGDLDGAAAAYAESGRLLTEMGSRDDESHRLLDLANIAARRGDSAAAREFYQTALSTAESDTSGMDVPLASASYAMFEVMAGNVDLARSLATTAGPRVARLGTAHPARRHLAALVAAVGLMIAVADEDLPLARERAATVYQTAVEAEDMPLLASVASTLAQLAHALGQPERAAGMLGSCAAVRGGEDPTDPLVTQLGARLRDALGSAAYDRAYAAGTALSRAEALAILDPATL
jgi:tetratricopeptide (TPR) repeat protein